jgi:hypothetical protein
MSKICFALTIFILGAISSIDLAQAQTAKWYPMPGEMSGFSYLMKSQENNGILLHAGIDTRDHEVTFRFVDITESFCKNGINTDLFKVPPYKVNGKYIQIISLCLINNTQILAPVSAEGRIYLRDQIMSGNVVTIETNTGSIMHFKGALPASLIRKIKESESESEKAM